jgi:fimbrial chaperone protein
MRTHWVRAAVGGIIAAAGLLAGTWAWAANFALSPMRVELSAAAPTTVLTISNRGGETLTVQVQPRTWRQVDGHDEQLPTDELIVNPALATIPPDGEQIVRIALRTAPERDRERAYRLVIREVPAADAVISGSGFHIALAMDIPAFVTPLAGGGAAHPAIALDSAGPGARVRIANDGERHLRLADVVLTQGGRQLAEHGVVVVLPGSARYLPLPAGISPASGSVVLKAQSNVGPIEETLRAGH